MRRSGAILTLVAATLAPIACASSPGTTAPSVDDAVVESVTDGDTIVLADGRRIRLVQIDAPELDGHECYAEEAAAELERLVPVGSRIRLEADPALDDHDRYGRELRYVFIAGANVNLLLARNGAVGVWFFDGDMGRYASDLLAEASRAKTDGRGLWSACPGTRFDPYHGIDTG
jgi:micrococcal nuclease